MKATLTEANVRAARPKHNGSQQLLWDEKLPGFGILVSRHVKSFVVKYRNTRRTIGRSPLISVAAARNHAKTHLAQLLHEKVHYRSVRFSLCEWLNRYVTGMRNRGLAERSIEEFERVIRRYLMIGSAKTLPKSPA